MTREELAGLEADVRHEISALKTLEEDGIEIRRRDISVLRAELAFVTKQKRRADPAPGNPETGADVSKSSEDAFDVALPVSELFEDIEDIEDLEDLGDTDSLDEFAEDQTADGADECEASASMDTARKTPSAEPQTSRLSPQEEKVIRMRFGLSDGREYTPQEIATALGVTLKQALEIEARALRLLRRPSRSHRLRAFLENGSRGT